MQEPLAAEDVNGMGEGAPVVELTEEQLAEIARREAEVEAERQAMLDALGVTLAGNRSKAIMFRESSGIEQEWLEDEEHYEGIDDMNRWERRAWKGKPPEAPSPTEQRAGNQSTIFLNITRPYCDAAAARMGDMLLPSDDRAWAIMPTPIPELADMAKGKFPQHILRQAATQFPGNPQAAQDSLANAVDAAMREMDEAKKKAEAAAKRIEDWHVQCQYHAEVRKVLDDCAKIGTGILKGPFPVKKKVVAFVQGAIVLKEEIQPASIRVDPWKFYPDPGCGENIHNGSGCWEYDDISQKALADLRGTPGYIDSQLELVLAEGPIKAGKVAPDRPLPDGHHVDRDALYQIWYYHGNLSREDMAVMGCACEEGHVSVPAQITMINNRVVRAVLNPLDTGELPYDLMIWQKRTGMPWGMGVSRQIRTPQEIVVAAGRNMMDNAGRGGGPQLVVQQGVVVPEDGVYEVTPWKVWLAGEDADMEHIDKAFRFVTIPMIQVELTAIIQLGLKFAEDVTGLPMLLQGQQGKAPDTLGGMQMLNNNATAVLRRIARFFDDLITEPHVRRYYTFLLQYGEDSEKGDFHIDARGSSALVQRDLENQAIGEMANIVLNPAFGKDPKKWINEYLRSRHLDPKRFDYDDEQWQQIVENMAKGPQDARAAIAQIKAASDERLLRLEQAFEGAQNDKDRALQWAITQIGLTVNAANLDQDTRKNLENIKAKLGETVIKLGAQERMQVRGIGAKQVVQPPVEPPGRAKPGQAFVA